MTSKEAITDLEHFFNTKENLNGVLSSQTRKAGMERINVIKQDLEVLEIIKNKYVNLYYFKSCLLHSPHPHETYNMSERMLTVREFDMIKEWLENDK